MAAKLQPEWWLQLTPMPSQWDRNTSASIRLAFKIKSKTDCKNVVCPAECETESEIHIPAYIYSSVHLFRIHISTRTHAMRIRVIQISTCSLASASPCLYTRSSSSESLLGTLLKSSDEGRLMDVPGHLPGLEFEVLSTRQILQNWAGWNLCIPCAAISMAVCWHFSRFTHLFYLALLRFRAH